MTPARRTVLRRLADADGWRGPGTVTVTDRQLVLDGPSRHRATLATVEAVDRAGTLVWVRRRRAHGWLLRCRTEADAEAVAAALGDRLASSEAP